MATTGGLVHRLSLSTDGSVGVDIGHSLARARRLSLRLLDTDAPAELAAKRALIAALAAALLARSEIVATDAGDDGVLTGVGPRGA